MSITEKYRKDYKPYPFDVKSIHLDFDFHNQHCDVTSSIEFRRKDDANKDEPLFLNGEELELLSISLDNVILTTSAYRTSESGLVISDVPDKFTLDIQNRIYPAKNTSLNGLYQSNHKYCTQCEAEGFRRITYFPDRPDVLTKYSVTIEAKQEGFPYLLSNGELTSSESLDNGRHKANWHDPHPKPSYLFALVAGDFDLLEDQYTTRSGRAVDLQIYVDKGKLNQCHFAMESLIKSMRWDEQKYALEYDLNRYMIVAVGDFNMGAMENKGLNVFNTAYVLANDKTATDADFAGVEAVIGHEYFHNWTGNRVTCRDWFQLSLKEGLTVFREQQFSGDMNSESIQRIDDVKTLRTFQFPEDAGPMAHPIRPDSYIEMNNFYTHTVYIKGAEVIRMLETIIGKRTFNQGVRHYLKKHDGQAVTCEDFVVAMEEVSGKDLTNFRHWYSQSGTPAVEVTGVYAEETGLFTLEFEQSCPSTPGQVHKLPFYIPVTLGLLDSNGETVELSIDSEHTNVLFDLNAKMSEITVFLDAPHQKISFKGLTKEPTPSLLRGFSAPVKLDYDYTSEQRLQLISSDSDPYVKWQANQELVKTVVDNILKSHDSDAIDHSAIEVILTSRRAIMADQSIDPAFKALQLELPSLLEISETYLPIPIQQLSDIWPEFKRRIATALLPELTFLADDCQQQLANPELSKSDAAQWRRLLVSTLMLAAASGDAAIHAKAEKLYHSEQSMTIKQGMLSLIHHNYTAQSDDILQHFYHAWQDEDLVIDKWFAIQSTLSSDDIFERMQALTSHADFNLNNPNKVRSVLMRFAMANPSKFHDESGLGYELISRYVVKLNKINPQVAARLCGAFNGWRKLECESRKKMIKKSLEFILSHENTSPDVYEIANKALAD